MNCAIGSCNNLCNYNETELFLCKKHKVEVVQNHALYKKWHSYGNIQKQNLQCCNLSVDQQLELLTKIREAFMHEAKGRILVSSRIPEQNRNEGHRTYIVNLFNEISKIDGHISELNLIKIRQQSQKAFEVQFPWGEVAN